MAAALLAGVPLPELVVWTVVGTVAGVLIDADHFLLILVVDRNVAGVRYWVRRPVTVITDPRTFLDDVEYEKPAMNFHRLLSHCVILVAVGVAAVTVPLPVFLAVPALVAIAVHIAADVAWDIYQGDYTLSALTP